jgi:hypothetical protein
MEETSRKGKAIPITRRDGPWDCKMPRLPHFLARQSAHRWRKVLSLRRRPPLPPGRFLILISVEG